MGAFPMHLNFASTHITLHLPSSYYLKIVQQVLCGKKKREDLLFEGTCSLERLSLVS